MKLLSPSIRFTDRYHKNNQRLRACYSFVKGHTLFDYSSLDSLVDGLIGKTIG